MRYREYEMWLREQHSVIVQELEPGCVEAGPYLTPTVSPNRPPWQMVWAVTFSDGKYFRVTENWFRRREKLSGMGGSREHFSFHYGPTNPAKDVDGIPQRSNAYPAIIRIDCDPRNGSHLHFRNEDHISQNRVHGICIIETDPFQFVRDVLKHRNTGNDFDTIMQFRVTQ